MQVSGLNGREPLFLSTNGLGTWLEQTSKVLSICPKTHSSSAL